MEEEMLQPQEEFLMEQEEPQEPQDLPPANHEGESLESFQEDSPSQDARPPMDSFSPLVQSPKDKISQYKQEFSTLLSHYPTITSLPAPVVCDIEGGTSPLVAYQKFVLQEQAHELDYLRQNEKNRSKSLGSLKGQKEGHYDPFLEGFGLLL